MYIDKHYPFEMIPLDYSLNQTFLDFQTLSIHYNQIYYEEVEKLNNYLEKNVMLQNLSLDELLFNENLYDEKVLSLLGSVYNHQLYFNSLSKELTKPSNVLLKALNKHFSSLENFYKIFKEKALSLDICGFVFLVCDNKGNLTITTKKGYLSPVKDNLCPILGLDLFEHAYFLQYKKQKEAYIDDFLKQINFDFVSKQYENCLKAIKKDLI